MLNQETTMNEREFEKGSGFLRATYYFNLLISMIFLLLSFFYYMINTQMGFTFFYAFFCYAAICLGIYSYNQVSRILLITIDLVIGYIGLYIVFGSPIVIIYYLILLFTFYTLIFDKTTRNLFNYKFNNKFWKLDFIILLQYIYLIGSGFIDIPKFKNVDVSSFMVYYLVYLFIFLVLLEVQKLNNDARILMLFLAPILVLYSILYIETNIMYGFAVIINFLTFIILLFDKSTINGFKKISKGSQFLFKLVIGLNLFTLVGISLSLISLYQYTLDYITTLYGIGFLIIYALAIFKTFRYSIIWKEVLSFLLAICLIISAYYFQTYFFAAFLFIPTALITLFALHFDYGTLQLFKNIKMEKIKSFSA